MGKVFNAQTWINANKEHGKIHDLACLESAPDIFLNNKQFNPANYLIPGWSGEGLTSKSANILKRIILSLYEDSKSQFFSFKNLNRSLLKDIFNEFLSYANTRAINFTELDDYKIFWDHLQNDYSPYRTELDEFLNLYCYRTVIIYLLKIRFISILCEKSNIHYHAKDLLNPNSFLVLNFKKSSRTELKSQSFKSNAFSWYRPNPALIAELQALAELAEDISVTDIIKAITNNPNLEQRPLEGENLSHAISNKAFGQFLNFLLVKFNSWSQTTNKKNNKPNFYRTLIEKHEQAKNIMPITCKFTGDNLNSLSLSHWLAQEQYEGTQWDRLLCPDFKKTEMLEGDYSKLCYELQFLTLLANASVKQNKSPIPFMAKILRDKDQNLKESGNDQVSMFDDISTIQYERIVLNLNKLPTKNPHFYLLSQIQRQKKALKKNGQLIVLSRTNLFVPSKSEKTAQLLKSFNLDGQVNLNNLSGKGKVPPFIYIFSLKKSPNKKNLFNTPQSSEHKNYFLSFKIEGELTSFSRFDSITKGLTDFFDNKSAESTPLYQKEFDKNIHFYFNHDTVTDGKLISSSSQDPSQITHPNFFKNLMSNCLPFDAFFGITEIGPEDNLKPRKRNHPDLLGVIFEQTNNYQFVLVVDFRKNKSPTLEIIDIDTYPAKSDEYGHALCHYYGLATKRRDININLFKEFFNSTLGKQIIHLSLTGKTTKIKAQIKSIFIPKFFSDYIEIPEHIEQSFNILTTPSEEILKIHPEDFIQEFKRVNPILSKLSYDYPWSCLAQVSHFKHSLKHIIELFKTKQGKEIKFKNPLFIDSLLQSNVSPLFPNNDDVFIELKIKNAEAIHSKLTEVKLKKDCPNQNDDDQEKYFLELYSKDQLIIKIYAEKHLLEFISFIMKNALHNPISFLLQKTYIPTEIELAQTISKINLIEKNVIKVYNEVYELIEKIIRENIS